MKNDYVPALGWMMTDIIRKAVELAGWSTTRLGNQRVAVFTPIPKDVAVLRIGYLDDQHVLDALAAQLVRQYYDAGGKALLWREGDPMTTIKAIVESGVLE